MTCATQPTLHTAAVLRATARQIPVLAGVLARAFEGDPFYEWLIPKDARREQRMKWFFELVLGRFSLELVDTYTTPELCACAIWKPPGDYTLSFLQQLQALPGFLRSIGYGRIFSGMKLMEHMDALHARFAPYPHVYLNVLGVDPSSQGGGVGGRLLEPMLARCDADGRDVYVETANAANLPFYERQGFQLRHVAEHPRFPTLWLMLRPPRSLAERLSDGRADGPARTGARS